MIKCMQSILWITIAIFVCATPCIAEEERYTNAKSPHKWRVIYLESGSFVEYPKILAATARNLAHMGLIKNGAVPAANNARDSKIIWEWLSKNAGGNYIEFLSDGFYSTSWDMKEREKNKEQLLKRIREKNDIDMILAFGTAAGLDMATTEHNIPILSLGATDAVQAGIIKSVEDSGLDHLFGLVELGGYERQITIFHDIFKFKKLGVPIPPTQSGRASIDYNSIENMSRKLGFEIVPCDLTQFGNSKEKQYQELEACMHYLSKNSDAIYYTTTLDIQWEGMDALINPMLEADIPSFSQRGLEETKLGILMSLANSEFNDEGKNSAQAISQVIAGIKPRNIKQGYKATLNLAINLETAALIGWRPPLEILAAVDHIYQKIHKPVKENSF